MNTELGFTAPCSTNQYYIAFIDSVIDNRPTLLLLLGLKKRVWPYIKFIIFQNWHSRPPAYNEVLKAIMTIVAQKS
jgi:hypothetical protein